ncbi:MAG: tetratricopeptide repeat protein [Candidatus Poribacteria bacterium]|nr:tetratricopeptide repeat protein [Candidatus Poribacteria bacterium]
MSDQKTKPKSVPDIIADIESRASGGGYIFRGETQSRFEHKGKFSTEVSSRLWRDYKFREEEGIDFDIERVQREMLAGAKKHTQRPAQSSDAFDALRTAVRHMSERRLGSSTQSPNAFNVEIPEDFEILVETPEDFEILTEIQHYGGRTNLIDFTTDYRIALFFACDGDYDKEGRVILQKKDFMEDGTIKTPWHPPHRVIAQKSVFVRPRKGYYDPKDEDIVWIQADLKEKMLKYLEKHHGIDKERIYNDLHGFIYNQDRHGESYTRFYRGLAYQIEGKHDKAIDHYDEAIKLNPRSAAAYNNRGLAYVAEDNLVAAISDYTKAIDLNPNDAKTYYNRGLAYFAVGNRQNRDNAIRDFSKAIELEPNNPGAYNRRGVAYAENNDYESAIKDFGKAIELAPNDVGVYKNRGRAYAENGNHEKAIEDYTEAIRLNPKDADAYTNRGAAYTEQGDQDKAIEDFNKAIEVNP